MLSTAYNQLRRSRGQRSPGGYRRCSLWFIIRKRNLSLIEGTLKQAFFSGVGGGGEDGTSSSR